MIVAVAIREEGEEQEPVVMIALDYEDIAQLICGTAQEPQLDQLPVAVLIPGWKLLLLGPDHARAIRGEEPHGGNGGF